MKTKSAPVKPVTPTKSKPVATVTAIPPSKAPPMPKARKTLPVETLTMAPVEVVASTSFAPVSDIQLAQLKIEWVARDTIKPNTYNPNKMTWQDRMLLRSSLLEDGWTQPIVTLPDHTIVDGEQRWTTSGIETTPEDIQEIIDRMEKRKGQGAIVSDSVLGRLYESKRRLVEAIANGLPPCIASITGGLVPITTINLTDEAHRMISTIRHNRARGSHKLDSMSTILTDLQKLGLDIDDLEKRLGMDDEEITRLTKMAEGQLNALKTQLTAAPFSASWAPEHITNLGANKVDFERSEKANEAIAAAEAAKLARHQQIKAQVAETVQAKTASGQTVTQIEKEQIEVQATKAIPAVSPPVAQALKKIVFFVTAEEEAVIARAVGTRLAEGIVALCRAKVDDEQAKVAHA